MTTRLCTALLTLATLPVLATAQVPAWAAGLDSNGDGSAAGATYLEPPVYGDGWGWDTYGGAYYPSPQRDYLLSDDYRYQPDVNYQAYADTGYDLYDGDRHYRFPQRSGRTIDEPQRPTTDYRTDDPSFERWYRDNRSPQQRINQRERLNALPR